MPHLALAIRPTPASRSVTAGFSMGRDALVWAPAARGTSSSISNGSRGRGAPACVARRKLSTGPAGGEKALVSRRAMLYVPGSNTRMLEKSFGSPADSVCYDLEDSVAPGKKGSARESVVDLLNGSRSPAGEIMVRVNAVETEWAEKDVDEVLRTQNVQAIALPKTNDPSHLAWLASRIDKLSPPEKRRDGSDPIRVIGMIESAEAMVKIHDIAKAGKGYLDGLLFAAEDYCADVGITRTEDRLELLYPRSRLVTAAKAHGLQAIDLVCVDYKDPEALRRECEEGRRLGFDGKQAIHPAQIDIIHSTFSPVTQAIRHAARVKFSFEHNDSLGKGSYSLDGKMIDAPVYKQALKVLAKAQAASIDIPHITESDISP